MLERRFGFGNLRKIIEFTFSEDRT